MSDGMKRIPLVLAAVAVLATAASGYDFFARARYPGPVRVAGVDLYKVEQQGGAHAEGYQRRVVNWWPRRGVDLIEVEEGMPLRTWTFRQRNDVQADRGWLTRQLASDQPLKLKAHLVGFRGIGNRYAPSGEEGDYVCPAAVLRLEDGRKRCFVRGTFIEEDEKYLLALYLKEMNRIRSTLKKVKYEINPSLHANWPDNAKPGEPGTMQVVGEHFMFVSGSQCPPGEPDNPWVGSASPEKARRFREGSVACAEDWWAYNEYIGNLMPYWDRNEKYKYCVTVVGTYRDGYKWLPGYAGGGYGACEIKNALGGPWSFGLFHEWCHGHAAGGWYLGGGEIQCDTGQTIADPSMLNFSNNIARPWRCCMHGSYKTCLFYAIMSQDPNWGYGMALTMPSGVGEQSVFQTLARLGEQRGLFDNGIRGVGDMVGEFTARLAELDCELQHVMRQTPSPSPGEVLAVKWNRMEPMDRAAGWYRIFREEAPESFGSNVVRLVAEEGAKEIRVDFRGLCEPGTYGDWRACIVAVGADGQARYSPLWNQGVMTMEIRPGDRRHWLTVAATPWALGPGQRYPYEVQLTGCRPGTPHVRPGDMDDYDLIYTGGKHLCKVPHAGDTPEAQRIQKGLARLEETLPAFKAAFNKAIADGKRNAGDWETRNVLQILSDRQQDVHRLNDGLMGARHPNGGGWVAKSAEVAQSAYVGPDAMVLDGARVLDHAVIENYAVVTGPKVVVSGHARLSGRAYVSGDVTLGGYARAWHEITGNLDKTLVAPEAPLREGQDKPDKWKLWANYALNREQKVVLEDTLRFGGAAFYELSLDGVLYGQPRYVVEDGRGGFQFDGRTQYAEAASTLADLGAITVDISLKWAGGSNQVVFDFGSSADNRFVLYAAGVSGRPELVVTRGGTSQRVVADRALPQGEWTRCRVEIDGRQLALWIGDHAAGRLASDFRPCDAFVPDGVKRNFLAAARDGSGHFHGTLDFVRVYHTVHEKFPEPRRQQQGDKAAQIDRQIKERINSENQYYLDMKKQIDARILEIQESTPRTGQVRGGIDEAKRKLADGQRDIAAKYDKSQPEKAARRSELASQREGLEKRKRELLDALLAEDKVYIEAREASEKIRAEMNRLEGLFKSQPRMRELRDQIAKLSTEIRESQDRIMNNPKDKDLVAQRRQIDEIQRQRSKLEQKIRQQPELKVLQEEAQQHRRFNERYRQLCDADAEIVRLRQVEGEKDYAYRKMLSDRYGGDPLLQQKTAQRDAASREMPEPLAALRVAEQYETVSKQVHNRSGELEQNTPAIAQINRELPRIREEEDAIVKMREIHIARESAHLTKLIGEAEKKYVEAKEEAGHAFWPEIQWLYSILRPAYSNHYNTSYWRYLSQWIRLEIGDDDDGLTEDAAPLEPGHASPAPESWKTCCDWQWRTAWELNGSIANLPLVREWLERARDDVLIAPQK